MDILLNSTSENYRGNQFTEQEIQGEVNTFLQVLKEYLNHIEKE